MHRFKSIGRMYSKFNSAFPKNSRFTWAPPSSVDGEDHIQKLFNLNRSTFRAEDLQQYVVPPVAGSGRTPHFKTSKVPSVLKVNKNRGSVQSPNQSHSSISKKPAKLNTKYVIEHDNLKPYRVKTYQDNIIQGSEEIGNRLRRRIANKLRNVVAMDEPSFETSLTRKAKNKITTKSEPSGSLTQSMNSKTSKQQQQTNLFNEAINHKSTNRTVLHAIQAISPRMKSKPEKIVINKPKIELAQKRNTNFRNEVTYKQPSVPRVPELPKNQKEKTNQIAKNNHEKRQIDTPGNAYMEIKEKTNKNSVKPVSESLPSQNDGGKTVEKMTSFPHILADKEALKMEDKFIAEGKSNDGSTNHLDGTENIRDKTKSDSVKHASGVTRVDIKKRPDVFFEELSTKDKTPKIPTKQNEVIMSERTSNAFEEHQAANLVALRTNRLLAERAKQEIMENASAGEEIQQFSSPETIAPTFANADKSDQENNRQVESIFNESSDVAVLSENSNDLTDKLASEMARLDNEVILIEHQLQDVVDSKSKSTFGNISDHSSVVKRTSVPVEDLHKETVNTSEAHYHQPHKLIHHDLLKNHSVEMDSPSTLLQKIGENNFKFKEQQKAAMSTAKDTGVTRPLCSGEQSSPNCSGQSGSSSNAASPCAAKNPCASAAEKPSGNPCAAKNPCGGKNAASSAQAANPCGAPKPSGSPCAAKDTQKSPTGGCGKEDDCHIKTPTQSICAAKEAAGEGTCGGSTSAGSAAKPTSNPCAAKTASNPCAAKPAANPCDAKPAANPCAAKPAASPCAAKPAASPCAAKPAASPCAAKPAASPCAAKPAANSSANPCAAKPAASPCAAKPDSNASANPCAAKPAANPCGAKPAANPCAAKPAANPCAAKPAASTCAAKPDSNASANPCGAKPAANPCGAKPAANPCAAKPAANPCAAKSAANPCAAKPDANASACCAKPAANPCAAKSASSNSCGDGAKPNPCAAKSPASDKIPCAASGAAANNPCASASQPVKNPCGAQKSDPCAAVKLGGSPSSKPANPCAAASAKPANPCTASSAKPSNPCAAASEKPTNPCAAAAASSSKPANPCAASSAKPANPCSGTSAKPANPCAAKSISQNPCASAKPANPCAASSKPADPCAPAKLNNSCEKTSIVQGTSQDDKEELAKKLCGPKAGGSGDDSKCGPKCQQPKCPPAAPKCPPANPCAPKCPPPPPPKCIDGMSDRTKPDSCGKVPIPCIPADQPKCGQPPSGPCSGKKASSDNNKSAAESSSPPQKVSPCPLFGQQAKEVLGDPPNPADDTTLHTKKDPLKQK